MIASQRALIVIDPQNDYLTAQGIFPLEHRRHTLANIDQAIAKAHAVGVPVVLVQHIPDGEQGIALFFNAGTYGAGIHPLHPKPPSWPRNLPTASTARNSKPLCTNSA
jgi:nicotinamidase-related amidase